MIITIVGKRGKGKTSLAKQLVADSDAKQIFIYDFLGEYISFASDRILVSRGDLYEFCQIVWNTSQPHFETLIVFDEIDLYGKDNFHIGFLYRYGRHKNINIIAIARRFYDLPVIVRSLTDDFYLFQITEERDINYLRRYIKEDFIQKLIHLPDFEYITISF